MRKKKEFDRLRKDLKKTMEMFQNKIDVSLNKKSLTIA